LYQFGDTFCHNFQRQFLALSNNNCAIVKNRAAPTATAYLTQYDSRQRPEAFNGERQVANLIEKRSDEQDNESFRWKIWSFSGIVEKESWSRPGEVSGWTVYEMRKDDLRKGTMDVFQYTGIAKVTSSHDGQISARTTSHGSEEARRELFTVCIPPSHPWNKASHI
jgi:hypothetical protein